MAAEPLPELAAVHWRPRVDAARLRPQGAAVDARPPSPTSCRSSRRASCCFLVQPLALPVSLAVLRPRLGHPRALRPARRQRRARASPAARRREAEALSVGLLGDLVGHEARALHAQTGSSSSAGAWARGSSGPPARCSCGLGRAARACCYCVGVNDPDAAQRRPHRAPAAGAARRRGGLRHRGQPRLQRRALARAPAPGAARCARRSTPARPPRGAWTPGPCPEQRLPTGGRWARTAPTATMDVHERRLRRLRRTRPARRAPRHRRRSAIPTRRRSAATGSPACSSTVARTGRDRFEHLRRSYD